MRTHVVLASMVCALLGVGACAAPPLPPKKASDAAASEPWIDHDKGVDVARARQLLGDAERALAKKDHRGAKRSCAQAEPFADDAIREEIRKLLQRVDESIAKELSPPVLEQATTGACQEAAEAVALIGTTYRGTTVVRFVRDAVSKSLLSCLLKQLEIDVSIARDLAQVVAIKKALNPVDFEAWDAKLDQAIVGTLVAGLQEPLEKRAWAKALEQLDELVLRKEAGPREVARVLKVVRAGVTDDVIKRTDAGLGKKGSIGTTLLRDIDALIAHGRFSDAEPLPDVLRERREEAAMWSICAAQDCTLSSPEPSWAFGTLEPRPVLDVDGKPAQRIKHGRKVFRLTEGRGLVLIAERDPGSAVDGVGGRVAVATGWVPAASLSPVDTAERLPPGDAIVGTRVWGPLRGAGKEWEIGVVRAVKGEELAIERVSDGKPTTFRRSEVRFGTVRPGTKVLALCVHPVRLEPAEIDEFIPMSAGDPHLVLTCLGPDGARTAEKREVLLGSLRSQAAWIPQSN
ncbi:MAG: hypothetical protein FJ096_03615 [Deltaproteobacteria bacterium]|nr:hypothetical protein [Deltaproteobacteria bacterium]